MLKLLQQTKFQIIIIVLLTTLAYSPIFANQFVIDDTTFVGWEGHKSLANIPQFFSGALPPGHEGVYRPIREIIYSLYLPIFGTNPFGYHLHSLLVHLASTLLVFFIARELLLILEKNHESRITNQGKKHDSLFMLHYSPFVTALLFGLHPIHTETISYISSSMESTGLVFFLASFYLYIKVALRHAPLAQGIFGERSRTITLISSVLLAILAYFTTEVSLTLPLVIVLYEVCFNGVTLRKPQGLNKSWIPAFAGMTGVALVYVLIRFFILNVTSRGPYLADSVYLTFLTMVKVFWNYISLLILPLHLANNHIISNGIEAFVYRDYRVEAIKQQSLFDPAILFGLVIIVVMIITIIKVIEKAPLISFGIGWFFITLLPGSEIVPQGSVMNEKLLYLPSFGFILAMVYIIFVIARSKTTKQSSPGSVSTKIAAPFGLAMTSLLILVVFYSFLTFQRNRDWHDNITLWSKDAKVAPKDNAYAYFQLGNSFSAVGEGQLAIDNYQHSLQINPKFVVNLGSIAKIFEAQGDNAQAINIYNEALKVNPSFWEAHFYLAKIYTSQAAFDKALDEYEQLLKINPNLQEARAALTDLPSLKEATQSADIHDLKLWLRYQGNSLSLNYPSIWQMKNLKNGLILENIEKKFKVEIEVGECRMQSAECRVEEYINNQKKSYGQLVNQGLARIPNFEQAYVRVWKQEEINKLEFFLFKGEKVVKILVFPADSPEMGGFNMVIGSLKVE